MKSEVSFLKREVVNEKCKALAKKIKELIDVQSTFTTG